MLFRLLSLASLCFCSVSMAQDFYVSPSGNDTLNGLSPKANYWLRTGPFKTLTRAQQAIRDLKAAGKFNEAITVHVGKGTYQLKTALEFNNWDSGLPGQEILWQGEKGATIISGGILLKSCQQYDAANPEQILSCPIDANTVANIKAEANTRISGSAPKFEVFVNENRMSLARWPNSDWAHIRMPLSTTQFSVFEKMPLFPGDLSNAQIHAFPNNDSVDHYLDVSSIDLANNQIALSSSRDHKLASGRRFYLQNIEAALDSPGEWFYDKPNNQILLIPPSGVTPNTIVVSEASTLITLIDTSHIGFKNLTLRHSTSNAINIDRTDSVLLDNLEINDVGGRALRAKTATNITFSNNHVYDTGLGGITVIGGDRPTLQDSGNIIYNNHFHHYDDVLFTNASAIEIAGVAAEVSNNLIENGSGMSILVSGNNHLIEKNEISHICEQASDCGAIYAGRDWTFRGNIIRYNYIHDLSGYQLNLNTLNIANNIIEYVHNGVRGIYLDDGVSGFNVYGNILDSVSQIGIQVGGGRDNRIENNLIKTYQYAILVDYRSIQNFDWSINRNSLLTMPITSDIWRTSYPELAQPMQHDTWPEHNTIRRNVIISTVAGSTPLAYRMPKQNNNISNNLVWQANRNIKINYNVIDTGAVKSAGRWEEWLGEGVESNSLFADPCVNITGGKISVTCTNSPIYQIGFQPIPSDIGLID